MQIALAQINTTAGDVEGNVARIRTAAARAREARADLLVLPELCVVGYPPRDLLLRDGVVRAAEAAVAALARDLAAGPPTLVGSVVRNPSATGRALFNAALLLRGGRVDKTYAKRLLPTYDVFDETRYFAPGDRPLVFDVAGRRVGVSICEDVWSQDLVDGRRIYDADPLGDLVRAGAEIVVNLTASPWHLGKDEHRRRVFAEAARRIARPLLACHLVGGNDDVLFDGRSAAYDEAGHLVTRLASFEEDFRVVAVPGSPPVALPPRDEVEVLRRAIVMGLRDYARKTGFTSVVLGLSGGVDSALTACLAAEALGPGRVLGVAMPGPYSTPESEADARALATRNGLAYEVIPVGPVYDAFLSTLQPHFDGKPFDATEENLQARARGAVLMALSNKHGHLVLTTSNKSELAVGYCTLYGDMCGGLSLLSDVWKTQVYRLAHLVGGGPDGRIPPYTLARPPSAELRPNQTDQDSLPPYDVLDRILLARVERGASLDDLIAAGEDPATVRRVLRLVERAEHKRRQAAPGLKVSQLAFGVGWRMPIARPTDLSGER